MFPCKGELASWFKIRKISVNTMNSAKRVFLRTVCFFILSFIFELFSSVGYSQIGGEPQIAGEALALLESGSQEGNALKYLVDAYDPYLRYHTDENCAPGAFLKKGCFELEVRLKEIKQDLFILLSLCPSVRKVVFYDCKFNAKLAVASEHIKNVAMLEIVTFFEDEHSQTYPKNLFQALEKSNISLLSLECVSSEQIESIVKMPSLTKLHLSCCGDNEIEKLAELKDKLEILSMSNSTMTSRSGKVLSVFSKLKLLKLFDAKAAPDFYKEMTTCNVQYFVYVRTNNKQPSPASEMFVSLSQWKNLKKYYIDIRPEEERVLDDSISKLKKSPAVRIRTKPFTCYQKTPEMLYIDKE